MTKERDKRRGVWGEIIFQLLQCIYVSSYPARACKRGKVIGVGVHIIYVYICVFVDKKIELYFSDLFTFSNIRCRTSRQIYRLPHLLRTP